MSSAPKRRSPSNRFHPEGQRPDAISAWGFAPPVSGLRAARGGPVTAFVSLERDEPFGVGPRRAVPSQRGAFAREQSAESDVVEADVAPVGLDEVDARVGTARHLEVFDRFEQAVVRGGDAGEELRGGEGLGRELLLPRDARLRDAQRDVDDRAGEDLHRDRVGVGGVEAAQVEHLLELLEHPLDGPTPPVERQRGTGRKLRGIEDRDDEPQQSAAP